MNSHPTMAERNKDVDNFEKYPWLGPIRMAMITIIAFGYASTMPKGPEYPELLRMFGYDPSWYGISVLFMMSGWLALRSLKRHGSALKFLSTRIGRNMPILVVFAALVPLVFYPLFGVSPEPGVSRLQQHLAYFVRVVSCVDPNTLTPGLLDNAIYMCLIQGGLWTFRWGMVAFVATAILWAMGGLKSDRILLVCTGLTLAAYVIAVMFGISNSSPLIEFAVPGLRLGLAYLLGMTAYAFRHKLGHNLMVPAGLFSLTIFQYFALPWTPMIEITATLAIGYLAYFGVTSLRTTPGIVKKMPDLSIGLYVLNWPIAQISLLMIPTLGSLSLFAVSFPLTVLISWGLWALITRNTAAKLAEIGELKIA